MKKTILFILVIILSQFNFSCKSQYSVNELNKSFSNEEIADLNKIVDFFKNEMCLYTNSDFKNCYKRIPHEYLEATGNPFWININFEKQRKLYNQISKSTFNKIWMFCKTRNYTNGLESKSICAISNGEYYNYLKNIGNKNPRIAKYAEQINASGDFLSMNFHYWNILKLKKYFDLNDPNIQLILAIHYLSLNDQEKRMDEWQTE